MVPQAMGFFVEKTAVCVGSGSDWFKYVKGLSDTARGPLRRGELYAMYAVPSNTKHGFTMRDGSIVKWVYFDGKKYRHTADQEGAWRHMIQYANKLATAEWRKNGCVGPQPIIKG